MKSVREDAFAGERLRDLSAAKARGYQWCRDEYGLRRHTTTQRRPFEHFISEEQPALRAAPTSAYEVPLWAEPKVARDHYAQVARALYSLPTEWIGNRLVARADRCTVRFYHRGVLVKTHARQPPGGRATPPPRHLRPAKQYALLPVADIRSTQEEDSS